MVRKRRETTAASSKVTTSPAQADVVMEGTKPAQGSPPCLGKAAEGNRTSPSDPHGRNSLKCDTFEPALDGMVGLTHVKSNAKGHDDIHCNNNGDDDGKGDCLNGEGFVAANADNDEYGDEDDVEDDLEDDDDSSRGWGVNAGDEDEDEDEDHGHRGASHHQPTGRHHRSRQHEASPGPSHASSSFLDSTGDSSLLFDFLRAADARLEIRCSAHRPRVALSCVDIIALHLGALSPAFPTAPCTRSSRVRVRSGPSSMPSCSWCTVRRSSCFGSLSMRRNRRLKKRSAVAARRNALR